MSEAAEKREELKPCPWKVFTGKLRPQFPMRIIEIIDSNGEIVIPWIAFDGMDLSYTKRKQLAERIVLAVNMRECRNRRQES